jgi:hypothetical protein
LHSSTINLTNSADIARDADAPHPFKKVEKDIAEYEASWALYAEYAKGLEVISAP